MFCANEGDSNVIYSGVLPVGDGEDGRVVCAVEVLVPEPVAAGPGGGSGVDAGHDRGTEHHIGS